MASQYDKGTDRNAELRERDKKIIKMIPDQVKAIDALRAFIKDYPTAAKWKIRMAVLRLDSKSIQRHGTKASDIPLTLNDIDDPGCRGGIISRHDGSDQRTRAADFDNCC